MGSQSVPVKMRDLKQKKKKKKKKKKIARKLRSDSS